MLRRVVIIGFLVTFILEIFVIIQVGSAIGFGLTLLLLILGCLAGGWVVRREGGRAWRALEGSMTTGRLPERELGESAVTMAGGLLLLVPGFITDAVGLLLLLPFTRPLFRATARRLVSRQLRTGQDRFIGGFGPGDLPSDQERPADPDHQQGEGPVIQGKVLHDD